MINNIPETSGMVSRFVESRIADNPSDDDIDLWCEKIYAALFSSSFNLFLRHVYAFTESEEEFNKELENFIKGISEHSSKWIETRYDESVGFLKQGGKIKLKEGLISLEIRQRLSAYFSIGLKAIIDKNFDIEMARSHSCFVVLSKISEDLVRTGDYAFEDIKSFFENVWETCDNLSIEMDKLLKSRGR